MERLLQQLCLMGIEVNQYRSKAIHAHYFKEADCLKQLDDALHDLYLLIKAGFNPNQPRVPSGNPTGGQWEEVGAVSGNDTVELVKTILPPSGKRLNRANIFIGGFDDDDRKIVRNSYSVNRYSFGDNYYTQWTERDAIIQFINTLPKGRKINIIGHSYGGDTATQIVESLPSHRINMLITIDPVSRFNMPNYEKIATHSQRWINVNAVSVEVSDGDISAFFGGAWNNEPETYADIHIQAPYKHEDFSKMMYYRTDKHAAPQDFLR